MQFVAFIYSKLDENIMGLLDDSIFETQITYSDELMRLTVSRKTGQNVSR